MNSDLELLRHYADRRDAEAFSALVGKYQDFVYTICRRILGDPAGAEDVAQECFLSLAREAAKVRSSPAGWLHRRATHLSLACLRQQRARSHREKVYSEMKALENSQTSLWHQIGPLVDQALDELPDELRHLLVEHFLRRRPQAELAQELGVSTATLSRRVDAGLAELRKKLKKAGIIATSAVLAAALGEAVTYAAPATLTAALGKIALAGVGGALGAAAAAPAACSAVALGTTAFKVKTAALAVALAACGLTAYFATKVVIGSQRTPAELKPSSARGVGLAEGLRTPLRVEPPAHPTAPAEEKPIWISILPSADTVKSLRELRVMGRAQGLDESAAKSCEWEIRTADNAQRVERIDFGVEAPAALRSLIAISYAACPEMFGRIGSLQDGQYLLAWFVGGRRCSNVMRFRIDKDHDPRNEPLLELIQIEWGPAQELPLLAIRAWRRTADDPAPMASAVAFATLNVDGEDRRLDAYVWAGPDMPLAVGKHYTYILELSRYRPPIEAGKEHVIFAKVGEQQSPPITLSFDRSLSEEWDRATEQLGPPPEPQVVLTGTVTGPAAEYHIRLSAGEERFSEYSDADGRYAFRFFRRPAAGPYQVSASPKGMGQPELGLGEVRLEPDTTLQLDLSFEGRFSFSGRVTYPDGTPAENWTVMASWPSPDGRAEYNDSATTDAQGRYTLAAPFPQASFVGWGGDQVRRGVEAGRNDVDFTAPPPDK